MIPTTAPKPASPAELGLRSALVHAGSDWGTKTGRGRPSREETERGEFLVVNHGYRIKGMAIAKAPKAVAIPEGQVVSASTPAPVEAPKVERVKRSTTEIAELIPQMRGDDLTPIVNGQPWRLGMRGTCNVCRVSLTHCPCARPLVWADHETQATVTFK